jgi:hypothetical protein
LGHQKTRYADSGLPAVVFGLIMKNVGRGNIKPASEIVVLWPSDSGWIRRR